MLAKFSFTITAIYGYNFCKSAATAFGILLKNVLRVAAINSVGFFILFLGKIGVVVIVEVIAFEWLKVTKFLIFFCVVEKPQIFYVSFNANVKKYWRYFRPVF